MTARTQYGNQEAGGFTISSDPKPAKELLFSQAAGNTLEGPPAPEKGIRSSTRRAGPFRLSSCPAGDEIKGIQRQELLEGG